MSLGIGELFLQLGVKGDAKKVEEFKKKVEEAAKACDVTVKQQDKMSKGFMGIVKSARGAILALSGALYAVNRLTNSLVQSNQAFLNLTRTTDIALSTFQKWNNVGRMFGIQNAAQQIEGLNQRLFELRLTGEGARGFQLAGVNPIGQDAEGVLNQLRNRISGMSDTAASYLLQQMGLDPQMLHILRMSRYEFEQLGQTFKRYQLTPEQAQSIQQLNAQLKIASIKIQYLKDRAVLAILPAWTRFIEFLASAAEGIVKVVNWVIKAETPIAKLAKGLSIVAGGLAAIQAILWAITAHPIIAAITAIIGAIMLLADDVNHYFTGGGSVLGVIAKAFEDFQNTGFFGDDVPQWLRWFVEAVDKVYEMWKSHQTKVAERAEAAANATVEALKIEAPELITEYTRAVKGSDGSYGLAEVIPDSVTPNMLQNANSTINRNKNTNINQTNYIQTTESADEVYSSILPFAQMGNVVP